MVVYLDVVMVLCHQLTSATKGLNPHLTLILTVYLMEMHFN